MKPSAGLTFPFQEDFENNCLKRANTVEDVISSSIRAYLVTRRGSRVGNMVGSFVADLMYDLVAVRDLQGLAGSLKRDLTQQFSGVNFLDVTMAFDLSNAKADLQINIKFSTNVQDNITDLFVTLPSIFDSNSLR